MNNEFTNNFIAFYTINMITKTRITANNYHKTDH